MSQIAALPHWQSRSARHTAVLALFGIAAELMRADEATPGNPSEVLLVSVHHLAMRRSGCTAQGETHAAHGGLHTLRQLVAHKTCVSRCACVA